MENDISMLDKERLKVLICGYINEFRYTHIIPVEICDIVFDFYDIIVWERNNEWASNQININKDDIITINKDVNKHSIFLKCVIGSGKYSFSFKIINTDKTRWNLRFGIYKIKCGNPKIQYTFSRTKSCCAYVFIGHGNLESHTSPGNPKNKYGKPLEINDIITMNVDLIKNELSFDINDIHYGKAYDIEHTKYKVGVMLKNTRNSVQFLGVK